MGRTDYYRSAGWYSSTSADGLLSDPVAVGRGWKQLELDEAAIVGLMKSFAKCALLLLLAALSVSGQVEASYSLLPHDAAASIAGQRVADRLGIWVAVARNLGVDTRVVNRQILAAELVRQGVRVVDPESAALVVRQEQHHSGWRRAGRAVSLLAYALAILNETTPGSELFGPTGRKAVVISLPMLPHFGEVLSANAPEAIQNILELSQPSELLLESGRAGTLRLFSAPYAGVTTYYVSIP